MDTTALSQTLDYEMMLAAIHPVHFARLVDANASNMEITEAQAEAKRMGTLMETARNDAEMCVKDAEMFPIIIEGVIDAVDVEDGGQAQITALDGDSEAEEGFFVRLQSWSPDKRHPVMDRLRGRKVRVTVEVIDRGDDAYGRPANRGD